MRQDDPDVQVIIEDVSNGATPAGWRTLKFSLEGRADLWCAAPGPCWEDAEFMQAKVAEFLEKAEWLHTVH